MARQSGALLGESGCAAKMLLDLSEEHKEHLAFLPQVDGAGKGRGDGVAWGQGRRPALTACRLPFQWWRSSGG